MIRSLGWFVWMGFMGLTMAALPMQAAAAPMTWNLVNVVFEDGGTATGSFTYDPDGTTNDLFDVSISVSGGDESRFAPYTYDSTTLNSAELTEFFDGSDLFLFISTDPAADMRRDLRLEIPTLPTSSSTEIPLIVGTDFGVDSLECFNCGPVRFIVSGSVSTIPEPSVACLLLMGLGGLGARRTSFSALASAQLVSERESDAGIR